MSDFIIPINKPYTFSINVLARDSIEPQNLVNTTTTLYVYTIDTATPVFFVVLTIVDAELGTLVATIPAVDTDKLKAYRSGKEDGYYLKPGYSGYVEVISNSSSLPIVSATIPHIYATPTSGNPAEV